MMKFNHQPFEEWLLSGETLAPEETQSLQEHLGVCEACRSLAGAFQQVETALRNAQQLAPAPGFVSRWQAHLAARQLKQHRRQTLWSMLFSIGGAMAIFTILVVVFLPLLRSPMPILLALTYELVTAVTFTSEIGGALFTVLRTIVELIPPVQWAAILVAFTSLGAVWVVAMHRLTRRRVLA